MDRSARLTGSLSRFVRSLFTLIALVTAAIAAAATPSLAATLRGVVVDPSDRAVERARVQVVGPLGVRSTVTDSEGRFHIADLPPATYHVVTTAPGLEAPSQRLVLADGDDVDLRIVLALAGVSEAIVVSAAQVELPLSAAPGSVTVVGAAELEARQIDTLGGALGLVPGLTVNHNGGSGALTSLFPRGGESDFTLVLIDGMRLNTFGGTIDLSQLLLAGAERIEIVRGPQSALYGSDAIGGVIHVVGRHGGRPAAAGLVEGGGRGSTRYLFSTSGTEDAWSWHGSGERQASDGDRGIAPATGERVTNDDGWRRQGAAALGWQPSASARVRANVRAFESERGAPGPYGSNPIGAFSGVDTFARGRSDHVQAGLSADHAWGRLDGRARQRWTLGWADLDSDFRSGFGESALQTRRLSLRSQTDIVLSASSSLSAGFEIQAERGRSTFVTGEQGQEVPIERRTAGYFGELRQDLGASMALTAGVRLEHIRRVALEADPHGFVPRPAFGDDTRYSLNPRLSWVWAPAGSDGAGRTRIHASAGTGIRPPDVFEIAFTDNPSLEPERSRSVEAGLAQRFSRFATTLQATAFHNSYDDLIVAVGQALRGASRYRTDNISNARARGLELGADWRPFSDVQARVTYTWLDDTILAVDGTTTAPPPFDPGDRLLRRPRHMAALLVQYTRGAVTAFGEARARGRTLDVEPNFGTAGGLFENPGHAVLDAGASVRLARRVDVFVRGRNLLDRRYEETLGFPAPGRLGAVGVRVAVGH